MSTSYEVIYFPSQGRAEPIRLMLALAGKPFVNRDIVREQWPQMKLEMPLGQAPVLVERDDDGAVRMVPQSQAIVRHLARTLGLAGKNEAETLASDIAAETALDGASGLGPLVYGPGRGDKAAFAKHFTDVWPMHGKRLAKLLETAPAGGFFAGNAPLWGDVLVFQTLSSNLALDPTALDAFPSLKAFFERMSSLPQLKDHLGKRPEHEGVAARPA